MEHMKSIHIAAFRGIRSLQLNELLPINILTGDNNCGKTSVLEVIESMEAPENLQCWKAILRDGNHSVISRELSFYEGFADLFDVNCEEKKLEYTIETVGNKTEHIQISAYEDIEELTEIEYEKMSGYSIAAVRDPAVRNPAVLEVPKLYLEIRKNGDLLTKSSVYKGERRIPLSSRYNQNYRNLRKILYISPIQHAEGNVFLSSILSDPELYEDMLDVLKEYDRDIISINYDRDEKSLSGRGIYKILSKSHKKALPLNVYGDGMKKAILLMSVAVQAKDGILLLDEFETAIHTSAMDKTFRWLLETCMKLNVQVFLTSHSKEAIEKLLRCAPELQDKMAVYTLYREDEKTTARRLTGEKAIVVQEDMGLELR